MGTIIERPRKGGGTGYHAQVVVKRDGLTHRESKTFDRKPAARAWIEKREHELTRPGALAAAKADDPTLSEVIDRYRQDSRKELGRTKVQVLNKIQAMDLGSKRCSTITSTELVAFASELSTGRKPQTVANYLSHLAAVFSIARPAWGYPLDPGAMDAAFTVTGRLGLTGKSKERDRRPTLDELDKLMRYFGERQARYPHAAPMQRIIAAAIFTTRRQEELTLLAWSDLDAAHARILVRDMKNPDEKMGNHVWCDLPEPALGILQAMPRTDARIFPYTTDAIGAGFARACFVLGIKDLRFHDLRHEGVSRLFEMGRSIPSVAAVSGHRAWASLKRYTHLRYASDRFADWPWLKLVTTPHVADGRRVYPFNQRD